MDTPRLVSLKGNRWGMGQKDDRHVSGPLTLPHTFNFALNHNIIVACLCKRYSFLLVAVFAGALVDH